MLPALVFTGCGSADSDLQFEEESSRGIEGHWSVLDKRLDDIGMVVEWEFTGKEVIVRDGTSGEENSRSNYTIDVSKSPRWITVDIDDSPDENSGDQRLGIFRIVNGELHLKQEVTDGGKHPTDFDERFTRFEGLVEEKTGMEGADDQTPPAVID